MPLPVPLLSEVIVIQVSLLVAVQGHPLGAVTLILPVSAPELCEKLVGEIEYAHISVTVRLTGLVVFPSPLVMLVKVIVSL